MSQRVKFFELMDPSKSLYPKAVFIKYITHRFNSIFKRQKAQICLMTSKVESKSQHFQIVSG